MAESVLLVHHHLSHQHLPPYRWGELKHEHKTGVLGVSELPLQRSVPTKLYTSIHINFTVGSSLYLKIKNIQNKIKQDIFSSQCS